MPPLLTCAIDSLLYVTYYLNIRGAIFNDGPRCDLELLVKQLTGLRRLHLSLLIALLTIHVKQDSIHAALLSAVSVFITANICLIYDAVDEDMFRQQVETIGPAAYTFVNALPGLLTQACCIVTVITMSASWPTTLLFCIAAYIPLVIQVIAYGMAALDRAETQNNAAGAVS